MPLTTWVILFLVVVSVVGGLFIHPLFWLLAILAANVFVLAVFAYLHD